MLQNLTKINCTLLTEANKFALLKLALTDLEATSNMTILHRIFFRLRTHVSFPCQQALSNFPTLPN